MDGKLESAPVVRARLGSDFLLPAQRSAKEYIEFLKSLPIADENMNSVEAATWLIDVDKDKSGAGYPGTSATVRKGYSEQEWTKVMGKIRMPMGKNIDRSLKTYDEVTMMIGDSKINFRLIAFKAKFSNALDAVETLSMVKEESGSWKVDGYWAK